jgi:hypothetical protein
LRQHEFVKREFIRAGKLHGINIGLKGVPGYLLMDFVQLDPQIIYRSHDLCMLFFKVVVSQQIRDLQL